MKEGEVLKLSFDIYRLLRACTNPIYIIDSMKLMKTSSMSA